MEANACTVCHSLGGDAGVGPAWQGLFGRMEKLSDGTAVVVDDAYLRESILNPNVKIVEGFAPDLMPEDFGDRLSEEQLASIIAYLRTL